MSSFALNAASQWPIMLSWLDCELASLAVCDDLLMVVLCSSIPAESCLMRGSDLRQKRND